MSQDPGPRPSEPPTNASTGNTGTGSTGSTGGTGGSGGSGGGGLLSNPRFLAAAAVLGVLVVLAVVLAIIGPGDDGTRGATPEATSSSAPSGSASESSGSSGSQQGGSACGLAAGSQQIPTSAPEADWELVGTVAAPSAPDTVGPADTRDGVRRCFAASPTGALFAAVNFVATTSDADLRADAVRQLAARGAGRTAALKAATATGGSSGNGGNGGGASSTKFQVAGFAVLNADDRASAVELAFRANTGALIRLPVSLRWEQGDWKVVLPPDGDLYAALGSLPDLTGYIPWSGA